MDKEEAKLILANGTLENASQSDPKFEEALRMAEQDTELKTWWESTRSTDLFLQEKLNQAHVPSDLKSSLYASLEGARNKRNSRKRLYRYFALAASLILAVHVYFQYIVDYSDDYTGPLADRSFNYSFDGPRLSYLNKDTRMLTEWLEDQDFELPANLPPKLLALNGIGCRPLNWSKERVALMCFKADTVYHLFIGFKEDFEDFNATPEVAFEPRKKGWTVSKWTANDYVFVLTAQATQDDMASMLAEYNPQAGNAVSSRG